MAKIFPETHSILQPRFIGPCKIVEVKAGGKCLVLEKSDGTKIVRNRKHVKLINSNNSDFFPDYLQVPTARKYERKLSDSTLPAPSDNYVTSSYPVSQQRPVREKRPVSRYGFNP